MLSKTSMNDNQNSKMLVKSKAARRIWHQETRLSLSLVLNEHIKRANFRFLYVSTESFEMILLLLHYIVSYNTSKFNLTTL